MAPKKKPETAPAAPLRTEPTPPPLEGGHYDKDGNRLEKLEDAPAPRRDDAPDEE